MADFDIDRLIQSEHDAFRRAFTEIEQLTDAAELGVRWTELSDQLEVHASAEEVIFYPALLQDVDDAEDDTEHAVEDHNEIRVTTRAVDTHDVGTDAWWDAFRTAREATAEHLEEEEHDVLPPFRESVDDEARSELGMRWLQFHETHEDAVGLSGAAKDPEAYVEEHAG